MTTTIQFSIPKSPHIPEIRIVKKIREIIHITSLATRHPEQIGWHLGDNWHLISSPVAEYEKDIARRYQLLNTAGHEMSFEEQEHIRTMILQKLNLAPCVQTA